MFFKGWKCSTVAQHTFTVWFGFGSWQRLSEAEQQRSSRLCRITYEPRDEIFSDNTELIILKCVIRFLYKIFYVIEWKAYV